MPTDQNFRVGRSWLPKYGESHPRCVGISVVDDAFRALNEKCKTVLCSPRGHGSREYCDDCGKSSFDLKNNLKL